MHFKMFTSANYCHYVLIMLLFIDITKYSSIYIYKIQFYLLCYIE